jgi:predicted DNA-binding transcriptional regulator YafY
MKIDKLQRKLERIDQLIRLKATGTPREFAKKLNISKSTVYEYLKDLKEIGADVIYDKNRNSFIYKEEGKLNLMFFEKLSNEKF